MAAPQVLEDNNHVPPPQSLSSILWISSIQDQGWVPSGFSELGVEHMSPPVPRTRLLAICGQPFEANQCLIREKGISMPSDGSHKVYFYHVQSRTIKQPGGDANKFA